MNFKTVRGMRDFLPENMKKKQFIEDFLRKVFERYGYEPLQTPIVEEFSLLSTKGSGGEAIKEEIYYFQDKSERELGLRYDLTVPLARIVATNPSLQKPFKRYCIGQVYRYDRPQAKRYREFTQADVDIVGSKSILADFECLQIACDVMRGLGFEFKVRVSDRRVLEALVKEIGIREEEVKDCFRIIDKMDKIGKNGVVKELKSKGIDFRVMDFIEANSFEQVKDKIGEDAYELEKLLGLAEQNGLKEIEFDLSLARGLEYYTGPVFEISLKEGPSVGAGGRFDKLVELYGGQSMPAVGISFGVDRLFDSLEQEIELEPNSELLIVGLRDTKGKETELGSSLRKAGIRIENDLMERSVKKNFEYADKKGIKFVTIIGENEVKEGKFRLKKLSSGEEKEFSFEEIEAIVKFVREI